jgi:Domain of unknown function (DUF4173)
MFHNINPRIIILVYSTISAFLLISNNSFNYLGWSVFGISIVALILVNKLKRTNLDWFLAGVAILSSLNFVAHTNILNLFFSFGLYFYATGWLIIKLPSDRFLQVFHLIVPYLHALINVVGAKDNLPTLFAKTTQVAAPKIVENISPSSEIKKVKIDKTSQIITNVSISILVLAIILPLLSFANPQFGKYIQDFINLKWIKDVINWLVENVLSAAMILRLLVIGFLYIFIPRLITHCQSYKPIELENKKDLAIDIPKIITVFTLFTFLAVQLQTTLNPELLTKTAGKIANETFFHLSVVCLVAFGLIYMNFKDKFSTKIWSLILLGQTLILGGIAFQSDWGYVTNWGLTHKRLYGFSIVSLVVGAIIIFAYFAFKNNRKIIQAFAILFCGVSVITNFVNMDKMIYKNPPKESTGIEQSYVNELGLDTGNLKERYTKVVDKYNTIPKEALGGLVKCEETFWLDSYNSQITYLKSKYSSGLRVLDWNLSEYTNYLGIKNINITAIDYSYNYKDQISFKNGSELAKQNCYTREYQPGTIIQL